MKLGSQLCGDIENPTKTPSPTPDMHGGISQKSSRTGVYVGIPIKRTKGNPYTSLYGIPSQLCGIVWPHRQPIKAHRHATKPWRRHALICFLKSRLSPACRWGFQCKAAVGNMHNPTVALHRCGLYMLWKVAGIATVCDLQPTKLD